MRKLRGIDADSQMHWVRALIVSSDVKTAQTHQVNVWAALPTR
jgi:hypothetical protein